MKYFRDDEFVCKCGCGLDVSDELKAKADKARGYARTPFVITSGARCLKHNRAIGSTDTSSHIKGLAMDIKYDNPLQSTKIIYGLTKAGFNRIGINDKKEFIHADIDTDKPNAIFGY